MHAWTARRLAESAEPPLNPNHPNHRNTVPMTTYVVLWGLYARRSVP